MQCPKWTPCPLPFGGMRVSSTYGRIFRGVTPVSEIQDLHGLLDTEARIVAENATHAVIALRVDKAFFARNLLLMAALAELMPAAHEKARDR